MNEQIQQVIDMVKMASPFVWHAAYRYAVVDGVIGIVGGICIVGIAIFLCWLAKRSTDKYDDELLRFFSWGGAAVCMILAVLLILANIEQLLTLDYTAIKSILDLVGKHS